MAIDKRLLAFLACGAIAALIYGLSDEPQRGRAGWTLLTWAILAMLALLERWWRGRRRHEADR
jgi:cyanate permease